MARDPSKARIQAVPVTPKAATHIFRIPLSPLARRRLTNFRCNRRGYWSLWFFLILFAISLPAEFIANDKPLLIRFQEQYYVPVLATYPETAFGGDFETEANYRDTFVRELIESEGWMLWPLIPFSFDTINYNLDVPVPSPPSSGNWVGTDDQGRDVVARLLYGFRISVLFGFTLTIFGSVVGVVVGASQGFWGGWYDLLFQRFMEIWGSVPTLFLIIIMASIFTPNFW